MNSLANSVSECQKINLNNRLTQSYEKFLQRLKTFEVNFGHFVQFEAPKTTQFTSSFNCLALQMVRKAGPILAYRVRQTRLDQLE